MKKIVLIQGPNMNYLGKREPSIYGTLSATTLDQQLMEYAAHHQVQLDIFYTQIEGEAIQYIYQSIEENIHGLIMNPAAFSIAGYALQDCLNSIPIPYIEIHISNIAKRKRHSILAQTAQGVIYGFGIDGYVLAIHAMLHLFKCETEYR